MPLFTPHFTPGALSALRSSRLIPTAHTGFTLPGGRLPNADGNLPPATIGDGGDSGIPPGIEGDVGGGDSGGGEPEPEAPTPEPESPPTSFLDRALSWVQTPKGVFTAAGIAAIVALGVYHVGKRTKAKKNNSGRR